MEQVNKSEMVKELKENILKLQLDNSLKEKELIKLMEEYNEINGYISTEDELLENND